MREFGVELLFKCDKSSKNAYRKSAIATISHRRTPAAMIGHKNTWDQLESVPVICGKILKLENSVYNFDKSSKIRIETANAAISRRRTIAAMIGHMTSCVVN